MTTYGLISDLQNSLNYSSFSQAFHDPDERAMAFGLLPTAGEENLSLIFP
jgi:hypothetical protein